MPSAEKALAAFLSYKGLKMPRDSLYFCSPKRQKPCKTIMHSCRTGHTGMTQHHSTSLQKSARQAEQNQQAGKETKNKMALPHTAVTAKEDRQQQRSQQNSFLILSQVQNHMRAGRPGTSMWQKVCIALALCATVVRTHMHPSLSFLQ